MTRVTPAWAGLALVLAATSARAETPEEKGLRLATVAYKANKGWGTEHAGMNLELINAHGERTTRKMVIETLEGNDDGDRSRSVFEWPADVKGTKLLTWTHKTRDDDQWLYLPAIKRVKRISSSGKSGSFMGSEFAYEDLGGQEVEKFTYKWIAVGKEQGRACQQNERTPVEKSSGYKRQSVFMDDEYKLPLRIDYFDRKNDLLKTAIFSGFTKHGNLWRIGKINVTNVQTKKRSILTWTDRKLGEKLDAGKFESTALEE